MYIRKVGIYMNGIDYSSLMSGTGLFTDVTFKGSLTGIANQKKSSEKTDSNKQTNTDKDTYEHTDTTQVKAGYDRPQRVSAPDTTEESSQTQYKAIDSEGIQEGIELSDAAKDLLKELREKYGDTMEISVANWSTDEESDYYASLTSKTYSVLINPELLEQMASDESVREQYESVISSATDVSNQLTEELGEDADSIQNFSITIDADGNTTYAVKLLQEMAESSKSNTKTAAELQEERLEKKKEEEKAEEKKAKEEEQEEKLEEKQQERIQASSIDELVELIKNRKASA
jgi:membrane-bound lytic murein transglycosylase B